MGPGQEGTLQWVQTEMQAGSAYSFCTMPRAQDTFIGAHKNILILVYFKIKRKKMNLMIMNSA